MGTQEKMFGTENMNMDVIDTRDKNHKRSWVLEAKRFI